MEDKKVLMYLNLILTSVLIQDYLDELKGTDMYKREVKFHAKGLADCIQKLLDTQLAGVYAQDEGMMVNLGKNLQSLAHKLAVLPPGEMLLVNQLIDSFLQDREGFSERNGITLEKIN